MANSHCYVRFDTRRIAGGHGAGRLRVREARVNTSSSADARRGDRSSMTGPGAEARRSRPTTARAIGGRVLMGVALVFFVVLLTAIFSFLGTLTCCVLVGMMMGSARGSRAYAIPVSLVFPAVTMALFLFPEPSVPIPKAVSLSGLGFGAFWVTYAVTFAVIALEGRGSGQDARASTSALALASTASGDPAPAGSVSAPADTSCAEPPIDAPLAELQGRWEYCNGTAGRDRWLGFHRDRLRFERLGPGGRPEFDWEGTVTCDVLGPFKTMRVSHPPSRPEAVETWIYCVTGGTLIIASRLDGNPAGPARLDHYQRVDCKRGPGQP